MSQFNAAENLTN